MKKNLTKNITRYDDKMKFVEAITNGKDEWKKQRQELLDDYLSLAAATPGSSLPSRNSKEAPPPVEI